MSFPYLVGIALIEINNKPAMPIGGKSYSIKTSESTESDIKQQGEKVILGLMLRVLQRSDEGSIRRLAGNQSLLLAEMSMEVLQQNLPLIKSNWIKTCDTKTFLLELKKCSSSIWRVEYIKYEGIKLFNL